MRAILFLMISMFVISCAHNPVFKGNRGAASEGGSVEIEKIDIKQIFAAVTGKFNNDEYSDTAFIIKNPQNEEYFELKVYLSTGDKHGERELSFTNQKFIDRVEGGFISIGEPSLSVKTFTGKPDSLVVSAEHFGVGRSASSYEVKFSYRNNKFLLSGIDWTYYDKSDTENFETCSFNLITEKYHWKNRNGSDEDVKLPKKYKRNIDAQNVTGETFSSIVSLCAPK